MGDLLVAHDYKKGCFAGKKIDFSASQREILDQSFLIIQ